MKRKITFMMAAMMLLAFIASPLTGWGQTRNEASFAPSDFSGQGTSGSGSAISATVDGVTFACNKGFGTTQIRCYSGGIITISSSNTITAISFTFSGSFTGGLNTSYTGLSTTSWEQTLSSQARITACAVTYTTGGSTTTTYTVTYDANGGTGTMTDENSPYEEGAEVTLLTNTFTAPEGMMWDSWLVEDANQTEITVSNGAFTMPASNVTVTAQWVTDPDATQYEWILTDLADLTSSDIFVIVGNNGNNYAMTNNNGTSAAPAATSVTVEGNKITSTVASNMRWNVSENATEGYTFYPNGTTETWLYCTNTNNGVRVGTNDDNKLFTINSNYIYNTATSRYVGVYNSADWRCYTSINSNIENQTFAFYKRVVAGTSTPSITADDINITYDATSGTITYTINDGVDGGVLTANTESNWLTIGTVGENVPFTCTANTESAERTATVTLTYTYNTTETATLDVTVTQAAAPVVYTTIPELFAAATSEETEVLVTFNNWVISGVSTNGKNIFVTDGTNGFVMYYTSSMSTTYSAGDILSGTAVSCGLKLHNGYADLLNVSADDLTITDGGTVTAANIAMADLAGVNTGALLHYDNLTCSIDDSNYYLSDGTTTIQVYNSLFAFDALEAGATYNITGVYQQYNSTKEILPRSAEDIVLVASTEASILVADSTLNVNASEVSGTLTVTYENITDIVAEVYFCDAEGAETTYDWITADINADNNIDYLISANEGEARTAYLKVYALDDEANGIYSNLVTINQDAYVAPGNWILTDLADLTADDVFVIVGTYTVDNSSYAMTNNNGTTNPPTAVEVTIVENTIGGDVADNIQWTVVDSSGYYTFYPIGSTETWLYCTNTNNGVRVGTGEAHHFRLSDDGYLTTTETSDQRYIGIYNSQDWRCYKNITGNIADQTFAFYKKVETSSYNLDITGYGTSAGGYYLIASPIDNMDPAQVTNMLNAEYDLYAFNEAADQAEWQNYKAGSFSVLESGKGYLYANSNDVTLTFSGAPYNGEGTVTLNKQGTSDVAGWNLIGNPYTYAVTVDHEFYVMNGDGTDFIAGSGNIEPMEGIFVIADTDGETATFSAAENGQDEGSKLMLNISRNRGNVIDRAIVNFGEGRLPKFMLNPDNTKVYIPQEGNEFAVVENENNDGQLPVNFKAAQNGTYTFAVDAKNIEMDYLHLIDNMTGADIDLMVNPSYTFDANTSDVESRFTLVFSTTTSVSENNFAYFNGSEWIIDNAENANIQVIDMLGRVVLNANNTQSISTDNIASGVYVIRLTNGSDVKTQKIVVE